MAALQAELSTLKRAPPIKPSQLPPMQQRMIPVRGNDDGETLKLRQTVADLERKIGQQTPVIMTSLFIVFATLANYVIWPLLSFGAQTLV